MNRLIKALALIVLITQVLLLATGCGGSSVSGKYYRDFGNYTSTTMYIELKRDMTYQTDGTAPGIISEGTYEVNGSIIAFYFINPLPDIFGGGGEEKVSGTITGNTITIEGATYKK